MAIKDWHPGQLAILWLGGIAILVPLVAYIREVESQYIILFPGQEAPPEYGLMTAYLAAFAIAVALLVITWWWFGGRSR
jgi:hypothetical protein